MRVAFDISGTLRGNNQAKVLKFFKWLQSKNVELIIWSHCYEYAVDIAAELNLTAKLQTKNTKWDFDSCDKPEVYFVDYAVDDDSNQTYLAAKKFIWVHDIPEDESKFEELLKK